MENKFKYLVKYSLFKKIKNKWFLIANIILAVVLIGLINIDSLINIFGGDFNDSININVIDNSGYYEIIKENLNASKEYLGDSNIKIKKEKEAIAKAKEKLKDKKDILLVVNSDIEKTFTVDFITDGYIDALKYQTILTSLNNSKRYIAIKNSNINEDELNKINENVVVNRIFLDEEKTKEEENSKTILSIASLVLVLPCFMLVTFLVQMIGAEINEEKSTRGMEIIIGNVSTKVHFFSKILASNLFVFIQSILMILYGIVGLIIRKLIMPTNNILNQASSSLNVNEVVDLIKDSGIVNKLGYVIPLIIILFILSFLAYSLLAGILASITTNMENFQQLQTPLIIINVIGYYLITISLAFPGATFIKVLSCIPLISISLAPSLLLSGQISVSILILAIILLFIIDYLLIKFGLKVYKVGILNYSETGLWKKMFKAIKSK